MNKLFKLFYGFAAMMITALAVSCSSDDLESVGTYDGSTVMVSLNVTAPDALETTRALSGSNSAYGGLSNVDLSSGEYVLRYQLKIYEVTTGDDETETLSLIDNQPDAVGVASADESATFNVSLTTGSTYKFVVWADFVEAPSSTDEGTTTTTYSDLHYDTSTATDAGWTITYKEDDTSAQLNDESRDAYFACLEETISSENPISIECSRPFAKLRLVTTDWKEGKADAVSIQYTGGSRFTNIDLLTGASESEELSSSSSIYTASIPEDAYDADDAESGEKTLVVDYLMTDAVDEQSYINFTYTATLNDETVKTIDVTTDVPIRRNYLTTVTGALLGGTETTEEATTTNVTITCYALGSFEETELEETIDDEEEDDSYTYPESYPETNDYSIGSVVFYSDDSDNAGFYSVSADDYTSTYASYTGLTAIGVVAVPSSITNDNTVRIVALKYGSCSTPDDGSETYEKMYWGYNCSSDDNQVAGGASYSYYYKDENGSSVSTNRYGYLPRYGYTDWTNGEIVSDWTYSDSYTNLTYWIVAPYDAEGNTNSNYFASIDETTSGTDVFGDVFYITVGTNDFTGQTRTAKILKYIDYESNTTAPYTESDYDYKTAETLTNSSSYSDIYPAASCCWRYSTTGTEQGDWYLPASGEIAFLSLYYSSINDGIEAAGGAEMDNSSDIYWSSTEQATVYGSTLNAHANNAWTIDITSGKFGGYSGTNTGKSKQNPVRPFLKLSITDNTVVNDSSSDSDDE